MNPINIKDKQIVSESEIDTSKGIMYDFGQDVDDDPNRTVPNADEILDDVIKILEYMNTPEMKKLRESNPVIFEETMEQKFEKFAFYYYSVFKILLSGDDITPLFKMLEILGKINSGKTSLEEGEKNVGKYLTKFLPDGLLEKIEKGQIGLNDIKQVPSKPNNKKK